MALGALNSKQLQATPAPAWLPLNRAGRSLQKQAEAQEEGPSPGTKLLRADGASLGGQMRDNLGTYTCRS